LVFVYWIEKKTPQSVNHILFITDRRGSRFVYWFFFVVIGPTIPKQTPYMFYQSDKVTCTEFKQVYFTSIGSYFSYFINCSYLILLTIIICLIECLINISYNQFQIMFRYKCVSSMYVDHLYNNIISIQFNILSFTIEPLEIIHICL
jgi:hypothetical protein